MGPGMKQVVGFVDQSTGGGNFGGECGAPRFNQWGLRRNCAKVREPSELRFGVVRGVGRGIGGDAASSEITSGNLVMLT